MAGAPRRAAAQGGAVAPQCAGQLLPFQDACQKAVDLIDYFRPQLGTLVAGGNAELGRGGTMGGLGRFSLGLRADVLRSPVPQLARANLTTNGARVSVYGTRSSWAPFPVADAAVGLYGGVRAGPTRIGGVDLLGNLAYVPTLSVGGFDVRTHGSAFRVGVGGRVGLVQETAHLPNVSVSFLRRELPRLSITTTDELGDRLGMTQARVRADVLQLTVSKRAGPFDVVGGVGRDRYDVGADLAATLGPWVTGDTITLASVSSTRRVTRTNVFGDVTVLALPFARLVGEIGVSRGGSPSPTYNSFGGRRPDQAQPYGALGVRLGRLGRE